MLMHKDGPGEGAKIYRVTTVRHHELRKTGPKKGVDFDSVACITTEISEKMSLKDAFKVRVFKTAEFCRSDDHKLFSAHIEDGYGRMF